MRRILFVALLAMLALVSLNSTALAQGTRTIDVTGHGDSSAKPDMMTLSFTVTAHSDSADECTRKESETSQQVIDALKTKLGDSAKVTTSEFSFSPSIEYGNAIATPVAIASPEPPATWRFSGEVEVFTETIEPMADMLETGLAAGAKSVGESGVQGMQVDVDSTAPGVSSGTSTATGTRAYPRMVTMLPARACRGNRGSIGSRRNAEGNRPNGSGGNRTQGQDGRAWKGRGR